MKVILRDIFNLFYPNLCVNCKNQLHPQENILCIQCNYELPFIKIVNYNNNVITDVFFGKATIQKAYSFLYYRKKGIVQQIIHQLKYHNREDVGVFLGSWFGNILKEKNVFNDIHFIVPVPLHHKKLKVRGYNQVSKFAQSLSETLSIPYINNLLIRNHFTNTQTKKNRLYRFANMSGAFQLTNNSLLENKHILLVDDIITTGATLYACSKELNKTKNINISIVTIAFTEQN